MEGNSQATAWKGWGIFSACSSVVPLFIGLHKMFAYENYEYAWTRSVNAYVSGDAYNYIINANYATAFFVLTGTLIIIAIGCGIMHHLSDMRMHLRGLSNTTSEFTRSQNHQVEPSSKLPPI